MLDLYQTFIHKSRYARYLYDSKRRENRKETVERYCTFMSEHAGINLFDEGLYEMIYSLEVVPSMRAIMTAGPALARDNVAGYNCAYVAIDNVKAFDEAFFILLNGTGIGYSVERQYINQLPIISDTFFETDTIIKVRDSKLGWAKSLKELIALLYQGQIPKWDLSAIRPKGSPLKVFGGRASGPEPLDRLFKDAVRLFKNGRGRKLNSLEAHDLMCYIASAVVVGGVRRSAMISLSNLSDERMRSAKSGEWYLKDSQRALANNSACYVEKPEMYMFMDEWTALYKSKSGERGIFNRYASRNMVPERRDPNYEWGTNPCSEIVLRSGQFCNLSEVICRSNDTLETLRRKVVAATILGTIQATLTDFRYLRPIWKKNTEEEALLGVSLTGIFDCPAIRDATPEQLKHLRESCVAINKEYASLLNINQSAAITCVKPSGTVSQLANTSSGIHPRHNDYYIRRARNDKKDPLSQYMIEFGVPCIEDPYNKEAWAFEFPMAAPKGSITRRSISAIEHLEIWKKFAIHYCEHKPSITCSVKEDEWMDVGAWVWANFDIVNGISFLPSDEDSHTYDAAPYEDITEAKYLELLGKMPTEEPDWDSIVEVQDDTTSSQELACTAGGCELL